MKVLLIGAGAMGGAILRGCLDHQVWKKEDVLIKGRTAESSRRDAAAYGVSWSEDGHEAGEVDMVIVAVKPGVVPQVLKEIAPYHPRRVLSIAAAVAISSLEEALPEGTEVIRVMPNTPASVGEGMTAIAPGTRASSEFIHDAQIIFDALGKEVVVNERQLDELGALSGAGPGYAFVIIDALADAGVLIGLPRKMAIEAAAQTLYGAARMVLETGRHPGDLKDMVCSPAGTTIEGVRTLEKNGFRSAVFEALTAAAEKGKKL